MAKPQKQQEKAVMSGMERLSLRVSSMINHPLAQQQRWVIVHRMDNDGDREWEEVMGLLRETDGIEMEVNEEDASVTLRWEAFSDEDPQAETHEEFLALEGEAPF